MRLGRILGCPLHCTFLVKTPELDVASDTLAKGIQAMLAVVIKKSTGAWHMLLTDLLSVLQIPSTMP